MSRFEDPAIITCAITGVIANKEQCPAIPYTPEEYAAEARRIVDEGGSMIHIHARKPDGTASYEVEDFRNITEAILAEVGDVVINYSTGAIGIPLEKRLEYLRELRPDVAALNMGSMNYAKYSSRRKDFVFQAVFENSFETIITFVKEMNELGIKPEHECFDSGHIANLDPLIDMGLLTEPLQVSAVMGVNGGIRANAKNVQHMADQVPGGPQGPNNWGLIGISRKQWMLGAASLSYGGNFRVGLEDNFYLPDGEMARSNGDLVAKAAQMVADVGRRPATVEEARAAARHAEARRRAPHDSDAGPLGGTEGARLHPAAAGSVRDAAVRRHGRRGAEGRGPQRRRLHPLDAALLRWRRGARERHLVGLLPRPQPQQALAAARPAQARGARRAAEAGRVLRRRDRELPPRRDGQARRRLRGAAGAQPEARLLRDLAATARTARCAIAPATTPTTSAWPGCSA